MPELDRQRLADLLLYKLWGHCGSHMREPERYFKRFPAVLEQAREDDGRWSFDKAWDAFDALPDTPEKCETEQVEIGWEDWSRVDAALAFAAEYGSEERFPLGELERLRPRVRAALGHAPKQPDTPELEGEGRLLKRLAEPAQGHDIELGERCLYRFWSEDEGYFACTLPKGHDCNHDVQPESVMGIAAELAAYPEVRWDRFIEFVGKLRVYGWLDREDGRADFLLFDFDAASGQLREWITSAHPHPASVVERLEGDESVECRRVEDHFDVPNAVRLSEPKQVEEEGDWPPDGGWTIWACPEPDCEEFDTQTWTNGRASLACAYANHPEAVRVFVVPADSSPVEEGGGERWSQDFQQRFDRAVDAFLNIVVAEFPGGTVEPPERGVGNVNGRGALGAILRTAIKHGLVSVSPDQARKLAHSGSASHDDTAADLLGASSTPQHSVLVGLAEECDVECEAELEARDDTEDRARRQRHEAVANAYRRAAKRLREKAAKLPSEGREEDKAVTFSTVQITTGPGRTHLEHFPGGVTLCGLDMFPDVPDKERPGFNRRGGASGDGTERPCEECARRARRYGYGCEIRISGSVGADEFRAALQDGGDGR